MFGRTPEQTIITHNRAGYLEVLRSHAERIFEEYELGNPMRLPDHVNDMEQKCRALISQMVRELGYDFDFSEITRVGVFLGNGQSWVAFATYKNGQYNADFKLQLQKRC